MKIAVTGANSSVGRNFLLHLINQTDFTVIAGIRSKSAAASLPSSPRIETRLIDYDSAAGLAEALAGADCIVHLAGILIESRNSTYAKANVEATAAVAGAAELLHVKHLVFISVVGADANSANAYFRSKGEAEKLVAAAKCGSSIIRTPILLGRGTAGGSSLIGAASQSRTKILGGGRYRMRPLDIDDLNLAILHCCTKKATVSATYELVGPESITYRELVHKTAALIGNTVEIGSIPIWLAKLGAAINSRLKGGGITPTVVDVITTDEVVEDNADVNLELQLTPLEVTLQKIIGSE
jgi:uncharacterized protein YbjT (DUF2867 family)